MRFDAVRCGAVQFRLDCDRFALQTTIDNNTMSCHPRPHNIISNWSSSVACPAFRFPLFSSQVNPSNTTIPAYPMLMESDGTTDLSSAADAVGIMFNGVPLYRFDQRFSVLFSSHFNSPLLRVELLSQGINLSHPPPVIA